MIKAGVSIPERLPGFVGGADDMKRSCIFCLFFVSMAMSVVINSCYAQSVVFTKRDELRPTGPLLWPSVTDMKTTNLGGDTKPDVVYLVADELGVCLNQNGMLSAPIILSSDFGGGLKIDVADFNGDGLVDIALVSPGAPGYTNGTISVFFNEGDNNYSMQVIEPNYMGVNSIIASDIDANSTIDIVVSSKVQIGFGWFELAWYENDGTGNFTKHSIDSIPQGSTDIAVGDIDMNGCPDIVYGNYDAFDFAWYENDGSGNFTQHPIDIPNDFIDWVSIYDMDQNGYPDILLAVTNPQELVILLNEDGGSTFSTITVCNTEDNYRRPLVVDLDSDGDPDIVESVYSESNDFIWYENDGTLQFTMHIVEPYFTQVGHFCALDITGNGRPDLVAGNSRGGLAWWENQPHVGVDLSMPAHQFTPGSPCNLTASIYNQCPDYSGQLPMFIALEAGGYFWFYPTWTDDLQYTMVNVTPGSKNMTIIDSFLWPTGTGSASGIHFYGLFTKPDFSALMGDINYWEFGWEDGR